MKIKILTLLNYIASFLLLAVFFVWSLKALKFDNFFLYTFWVVIATAVINLTHFLSNFLYGGSMLYYLCLIRYIAKFMQGFLFLGITMHSNIKLAYIHNNLKQRDFLKRVLVIYVMIVISMLWYLMMNLEQKDEEQSFVMIFQKNSRLYISHELERLALFLNCMVYSLNLWLSFRYFVRLSSKHNYLLISAVILCSVEFLKIFFEFIEGYIVVQIADVVAIFFVLGSQSHITKREKILLTLFE